MCTKDCQKGNVGLTEVKNMKGTLENQRSKKILEEAEYETTQCVELAVKKSQKVTKKGLLYKLKQLKLNRERLNVKLLRECGMINNMMYSIVKAYAVRGEMDTFVDLIKLFTPEREEYQQLLSGEDLQLDIQWIKEQDERMFLFKQKVINWLKEAELNNEEVRSVGLKSNNSRSSKALKSSRNLKSSIKYRSI